jgi:hypothetical protein
MMVVGEEDKSVIQFTDIPQKEIEAEFKHEIYQLLIINEKRYGPLGLYFAQLYRALITLDVRAN